MRNILNPSTFLLQRKYFANIAFNLAVEFCAW